MCGKILLGIIPKTDRRAKCAISDSAARTVLRLDCTNSSATPSCLETLAVNLVISLLVLCKTFANIIPNGF
jgi:hypothetical protein